MIRIGIAGIGFIAEEYIKLVTTGRIQNAEVRALSSRNHKHMEQVREKYQLDAALFTDYGEMLNSGLIDAVMICTPHYFHPSMAIRAIERGIHTMIEKPVGVYPEELDALMACVKEHPETKAGVLYCRRTSPVFAKIKKILDDGTIGSLKRVTWIVTNMYRTQAYFDIAGWRGTYGGEGGGLLMNQVSHHIDLLTWLCGFPKAMQAHCYTARERNIEVENEVSITMEYPGEAIGQFIASTRECPGSNRLELSGSRGQIVLDSEENLTLHILDIDEREFNASTKIPFASIPYKKEMYHFDLSYSTAPQASIVNSFIASITEGTPIACPVEEAILSQQFIIGAYLSSWLERKLTLPVDGKTFTEELKKRQ